MHGYGVSFCYDIAIELRIIAIKVKADNQPAIALGNRGRGPGFCRLQFVCDSLRPKIFCEIPREDC